MNKLLLSAVALLFCALPIQANLNNSYDEGKPVGWGENVTGSSDANPITVTTYSEFVNACKVSTAKTIYVKGEISFNGYYTLKTNNKTIYGLPGSAFVNTNRETASSTGILNITGDNIILRNMTFKSAGSYDIDGNDNITINGGTNIWIDHCDIQDGVDGNLDIVNGANNVSVTWTRFRYLIEPQTGGSGGAADHRNCNLIGNSDSRTSDEGKLQVTFKNCWWDEGCHERCPRVRYGKVHVANCLFTSEDFLYCIGYGYKCNIYAEGNAFISKAAQKTPWKIYAKTSGSSYRDYNITAKNNLGASDFQSRYGSAEYWIPSDSYKMDVYDASQVKDAVGNEENGAGATLSISEGEAYTTGIEAITATTETTNNDIIYNLSGQQVDSNYRGIVIKNGKKYMQK